MFSNDLDAEYMKVWKKSWDEGTTKWHKEKVDLNLQKYFERIRSLKKEDEQFDVFVPLCGKTVDIEWLLDQGCTVVGVEGVKTAIKELFEENNLTYSITSLQNDDSLFETEGSSLKVYHCNLFDFPRYNKKKFDMIWDRGSFVAINLEQRERYASLMKDLYAPKFYHLLESVRLIPLQERSPRNLTLDEIRALLGDTFTYESLEEIEKTNFFSELFKTELEFFYLSIILIYRK